MNYLTTLHIDFLFFFFYYFFAAITKAMCIFHKTTIKTLTLDQAPVIFSWTADGLLNFS